MVSPVETPNHIGSFDSFCRIVGFELEPFQRRIAKAARGSERELLVLLARGNGKSRLVAALAVHHLLTTERAAVYVAAASRDQASVIYEYARDFARHPALAQRIVVRHLELRAPGGGFMRVLASDAPKLHGLTPSLVVLDELHAFKDASVYEAMRTALVKRPGARMIVISTAGQGADSPLGRLRARALAQPSVERRGALTEARGSLRMLAWELADELDADDLAAVKKCNPASWITLDSLREQREAVPDLAFRRYHCNQWTAREGSWLPAGAWQGCAGRPSFEPGERIWIGVDVGGERADSAVVWVSERLHIGVEVYEGDEGVLECAAKVRELAGRYSVAEVVFDPWRFTHAAMEFEREGLLAVSFPQTDSRMIPASDRLYRAVIDGRLVHPNDARLNAHAAAAIARHSRRGWRIDKANRADKIDAVVALCMAVERAESEPEPVRLVGWI